MKKAAVILLAFLALLTGCADEGDRNTTEEGHILLDCVYASEKLATLNDGGAYLMAPTDGLLYYSGYNEEDYDVFAYDGTAHEGLEYGLLGAYGLGAADGGLAFVQMEWHGQEGAIVTVHFTDGDSVSEGIDFTYALPGIAEEIDLNGIPDFTVGRIPGGAAVSDGRNVALVTRDKKAEKLELPGSILSVTANAKGELCLYLVNAVADRFVYLLREGELVLLDDDVPEMKSKAIYHTEDGLLMLTEEGFYRIGKGQAELILNFEHSSLVWSDVLRFAVVSEDEIYYSGRNDVNHDNGLYRLTPADDQYRKIVDVLNYSDDALDTFAVMFNASQSEYFVMGARPQIEITSNTDALLSEFDKKLIDGDCGDLVCMGSGFDWENYADAGIFADLSHLFAPGELFDCVTDALNRGGKLYTVCRSFYLRTMYTLDDFWLTNEMTPDSLITYAQSLGEDSRPLWSMSRSNVQSVLLSGMGAYIGETSNFSCESFTDSLGYIASMPEVYDTHGLGSGAEIYANGSVKFKTASVFSIESWLDMHRFEVDGKKFTETGFPTIHGGRAVISPLEYYAIPEDADEKAGAEEFLRFLLICHTRMGDMGIDADVTAFRDKMEEAKAYYFEYEPGRIENFFAGRAENFDPENENHELVTDALIAEFEAWLTQLDCVIPMHSELESIINEEIGAYLAGICTAEECADRIDSRIGIYLSERS